MRRKLKAVFFDMDGVMIDSEREMFDMLRKTLRHKNVELPLDEIIDTYMGFSSNYIYSTIIEKYGFPQSVEEFRKEHYRLQGSYYADGNLEPIPGLIMILDYLSARGVRMAIVSSTGSRNVLQALNRLAVIKYFDFIITGDIVESAKPSPEGYMRAAKYLGVTKSESFVIEDSKIGIKAAKGAGLEVVGFSASEVKQDLSGADTVAASFEDLIKYIESQFEF